MIMYLSKAYRPSKRMGSIISSHDDKFHNTAVIVSFTDSSWVGLSSLMRAGTPHLFRMSSLFSSFVLPHSGKRQWIHCWAWRSVCLCRRECVSPPCCCGPGSRDAADRRPRSLLSRCSSGTGSRSLPIGLGCASRRSSPSQLGQCYLFLFFDLKKEN